MSFAPKAAISIESTAPLRQLDPSFFGFSFVWVEFQQSLWNRDQRRVRPEAIEWLRAFPGAVYRYPGGTESNHFDWRVAVGPTGQRAPRKAVKWEPPLVANFGLDEYLQFVTAVDGRPWYVLNVYGEYGGETSTAGLAEQAAQLASYLYQKRPHDQVLRWELGNELDRGQYAWDSRKYVTVARQVAQAVREVDPHARFVAILEDYDAHWKLSRTRAAEYNTEVANGLADLVGEYAQHSYYDGVNVEVPLSVANRIAQLCKSIDTAAASRQRTGLVGVWVTEHARQPVKASLNAEWRPTWSKSADLQAALGVADFIIGTTQVPEVKGQFIHALHGLDVPWPMFHKGRSSDAIHPSAVYWALRILRQSIEKDVFATTTTSPNLSHYFGGYDIRATVMANPERTRWSIWAINRSQHEQIIKLTIPQLAGMTMQAKPQLLGDGNLAANNYLDGKRLIPTDRPDELIHFGRDGGSSITIPAQSIAAIQLVPR